MAVRCDYCKGTGVCPYCDGTGRIKSNPHPSPRNVIGDGSGTSKCIECDGSGKCVECSGKGSK